MDANTKLIVIAVIAALVGVGAGYGISAVMSSDATDYHFYLYFDEDDERNGWYAGKGTDAAVGFDNAMKDAKLGYDINHGYVSKIDDVEDFWSAYEYLYKGTSSKDAEGSIDGYGEDLNGWNAFAGYYIETDSESKSDLHVIKQSNSNIFFFSIYEGMSAPSPAEVEDWMNSGPFKA